MILITGASGLIGRAVALNFSEHSVDLRLQTRSVNHIEQATVIGQRAGRPALAKISEFIGGEHSEAVEFDFAAAGAADYERLTEGCSTVIHCAGLVHDPSAPASSFQKLNVDATRALATASKKAGVGSFIFLSTSAVYGNGPFELAKEDGPLAPATEYAKSKLESEVYLRENQPCAQTIILRPSLVFGEGDRGNMIALIRQIKSGLYVNIAENRAEKSVIYAGDVAQAIWRCTQKCPVGYTVFNVSNPSPVEVTELSSTIASELGKSAPPVVPGKLMRSGARLAQAIFKDRSPVTPDKIEKLMTTTTLSVDKLAASTGFSAKTTLAEAIRRELIWFDSGTR